MNRKQHRAGEGALAKQLFINELVFAITPANDAQRCNATATCSRATAGRWHAVETEHPDTFAAMYQFWLQKP